MDLNTHKAGSAASDASAATVPFPSVDDCGFGRPQAPQTTLKFSEDGDTSPPATDCFTCKKRRINCDRSQPTCQKCKKKGVPCAGYRKPKIIWKVLRVHESSQPPAATAEASCSKLPGTRRARASVGASVRANKKVPLLDIGYTFKVDITTRTPVAAPTKPKQTCEDMAKPKSEPPKGDDTDIETIPRLIDPYYHNVDYFSRDNLYYYQDRICLTIEYFKPIRPKSSEMICAAYNPMKDLISIASQSPLLLNSMLSVAARHRYETFNTEIVPMGKSTFDSKKIFISALQYRSRAIRLMRNHFLETSSANIVDVVDETSAPLEQVRKRELWESPQLLVALLLFMYFEIIDGGQGDGSWRKHLEVAKWGVYHRENRGLQLGMGHYWDFMREHFEIFDAVGSTFSVAEKVPSVQLWLQPRGWEGSAELHTEFGSVHEILSSPVYGDFNVHQWHPLLGRTHYDSPSSPDPIEPHSLIIIPRFILKLIHRITTLRRIKAHLENANADLSTIHEGLQFQREHLLNALMTFNPIDWAISHHDPARSTTRVPWAETEDLALGVAFQQAAEIFLRLALFPATDKEFLTRLTAESIRHLRMIARDSLLFRSLVWPCVVTGVGAQTKEQMLFVRTYMGHLRAGMPCVGVARACDALERLWGVRMKRTGGVYNGGTEGWEEAVGCFAGEWLFI